MTVLLIRHGQSKGNVGGRLVGVDDPSLSAVGEAQVASLAARLAGRPCDRVVSSPRARARQTAAALAGVTGAPVIEDATWSEMDYGDWEGVPVSEIPRGSDGFFDRADFRPPRGESLGEMHDRVVASLGLLSPSENVWVVSHMGPIKIAILMALGCELALFRRIRVDEASLSELAFRGGWSVSRINDTAHCENLYSRPSNG